MRFCLDRAEERRFVEDVDTPRYSFSMNGFVLARGSCSSRVFFFRLPEDPPATRNQEQVSRADMRAEANQRRQRCEDAHNSGSLGLGRRLVGGKRRLGWVELKHSVK